MSSFFCSPFDKIQGRIVGSLLGSAIIVVGLVIIAILYQKNQQSLKKEQPKPNPYISQVQFLSNFPFYKHSSQFCLLSCRNLIFFLYSTVTKSLKILSQLIVITGVTKTVILNQVWMIWIILNLLLHQILIVTIMFKVMTLVTIIQIIQVIALSVLDHQTNQINNCSEENKVHIGKKFIVFLIVLWLGIFTKHDRASAWFVALTSQEGIVCSSQSKINNNT